MLLEFFQAITGVFVVVYDGQHALKFTLGRAEEVVGPGVHWKWPIIQRFRIEETKHTTLDLEPQVIQLADDLVYEIDCKVVYQIVDLRKALVEIDDLVMGLKNRVVMAVQSVVSKRDRRTVRDAPAVIEEIRRELAKVEEQWGVRILVLGFSNISPSPTTLEITQLELLAREKLALYERFRGGGLSEEAAVALISGAVVAVQPDEAAPTRAAASREEKLVRAEVEGFVAREQELAKEQKAAREANGEEPGEAGKAGEAGTAGD
jgi:regulator of protease activity HflC (stomatin/prohibitin superfamily)